MLARSPSKCTPLALACAAFLAACGGGDSGGGGGGAGIRVNQVGYAPGAAKNAAVVASSATTFQVVDEVSGLPVGGDTDGSRPLTAGQSFAFSGEEVQVADFSDLTVPGTYHLEVAGLDPSPSFTVADDVYRAPALATLKAFYYWRASTAIDAAHGGQWTRAAGHPNTGMGFMSASFSPSAPKVTTATTWDAPKGWYDAGDYGEYVVNAGITVGSMLAVQELYPGFGFENATNIPESGAGKNDLLEEVRWELAWMLRMQDDDGGVFFKIAGASWPGWVMPAADPTGRQVIGKSTTSTLDFAAVMAQAARVYAAYDATLSEQCWTAATRAYVWARAHANSPAPGAVTPAADAGSGGYGDGDYRDEFAWAAAELYITSVARGSADSAYLDDANLKAALDTVSIDGFAGWQTVKNLAYYSLATSGALGGTKTDALRAAIRAVADDHVTVMSGNPYGFPLDHYSWGSAAQVANAGVVLVYAARFAETADDRRRYLDHAVQAADYILGKNTLDTTFVTGVGTRSPQQPHSRISQADGVGAPFPGLVTGGPNSGVQDHGNGNPPVTYPRSCSDAHPAYCWVDYYESYASNEPAINQNAAAFLLFAGIHAELND
jgi:endoglucanase